jgi:hypothetical protein
LKHVIYIPGTNRVSKGALGELDEKSYEHKFLRTLISLVLIGHETARLNI